MRYFFLLCFTFFISKTHFAQKYTENVDGSTIKTNNNYFNSSLKKEAESATDYISIYQKYISGIRGGACPMYPSCSNYGMKTFSETNFVEAMSLTADRLLRCGHDHGNYHSTLRKNGFKLLDYPYYDEVPEDLIYKRSTLKYAYSDLNDDDKNIEFIKRLINNGYYNEALLEIMRLEFTSEPFHNKTFNSELFINKMICLRAKDEHEKAIFEYETTCPKEFKTKYELLYQASLTHYQLGNFALAQQLIEKAIANCDEDFSMPKLISFNGLVVAKQNKFKKACSIYSKLNQYNGFKDRGTYFNKVLSQKISYKNPTHAGLLAIIPGAGYVYAGHKQTALSAFIVNGLLAYASYSSFKNDNTGLGILTGVFGLSFYIGNIQGSVKSAKRFNKKQKEDILRKLENTSFF